ncbi:MAG: 3-hydroxyacyl-CoA dehydrogenase [Xanthomonadales bacterium]|nr:3-hydroxyacyl-CoA dehydrogenase [Xanthomonadales bacterium]
MNNTIRYTVDNDGIATLMIDLPGKSMNVLCDAMIADLSECIDKVAADEGVKGAILASAKKAFVAGADLTELVTAYDRGVTPEEGYEWSRALSGVLRKMETCGKPFAVAINGLALGGGLELCLACHYRVMTDHPRAVLGLPEVSIGLLPGAGGTQRLPRLVGTEKSLPVILQGKKLQPQKALELGVVHEIAPAGELLDRARAWLMTTPDPVAPWDVKGFRMPGGAGANSPKNAQQFMVGTSLVAGMTQHNYPAPIGALSAVYEGCITPFDTGLDIESQYFGQLVSGVVARNMMRSLFVNKGAADKLARRPGDVEKSAVTKLGILGAGMMGAGIAYVSARAGMQVVLLDTDLAGAERGKAYSEGLLGKAIKRGYSTQEKADALLSRIHPTTDYADLEGCELVIEAVFENREIKAGVTAKTEAVIPETAIFASNTSTLPITGLAEASRRPERFIGLHFFSPVDKMPLVELIKGEKSSDEAVARGLDYIQQIRKTPVVVNDSPGFYTSRCFSTSTNEGMTMLAEGIKPALIENAAKMAGLPVGPLAVMDEVTLELGYKITMQTASDFGDDYKFDSGFPVIRKFVEELDRKGKRYGKGFYEYPEGGKKYLWPGLAELYPPKDEQPPVQEVIDRLLYRQALETARCFEEGVLDHPADADIGSIFGWGFPPWTGGTLSFIDTVGIKHFVAQCDRMAEVYGSRFEVSDWLRRRAGKGEGFHQV